MRVPRCAVPSPLDEPFPVLCFVPVKKDRVAPDGRVISSRYEYERGVKPLTWNQIKANCEKGLRNYDTLTKPQRDYYKLGLLEDGTPHPYELRDLRRLDPETEL